MKTLLLALFAPERNQGTREGAVRGLSSLGDQGIKKGLIESKGAKMLGDEMQLGMEDAGIVHAVLVGFLTLSRLSLLTRVHALRNNCRSWSREARILFRWTIWKRMRGRGSRMSSVWSLRVRSKETGIGRCDCLPEASRLRLEVPSPS